ncbi:MAG: beta-glucosidase [Candidatus Babeliales bacterium]
MKKIVLTIALSSVSLINADLIHWNWKSIDSSQINGISIADFFKNHAHNLADSQEIPATTCGAHHAWLWGTATAAHQVEGNCTNNQWYLYEGKMLNGAIVEPAGIACDHWNRYKEDIQLMKELGVNAYRFSVEWSKIEPMPGVYDEAALDHYEDVCKELIANGIKPVITLYHYTEPIWFYHMGSFEKRDNCKYFTNFCAKVFERLHPYVYLWLTFCSPETAAKGWLQATMPPAKKDMKLMVHVLYNICETHVDIYRKFKSMPGGEQSRIGIHKTVFQLDPWNRFNPLDHLGCAMADRLINKPVYEFFTTGEFNVYIPFKVNFQRTNTYLKNGGQAMDYVGLSYYCHNYMSNFKTFREPNPEIEIPCNHTQYTIYGEGLYRAIQELSERIAKPLNIPIYVTENGIGTDNDDHRILQSQRYLYALASAIADGHYVCGYIHWSLLDNYEWGVYKKRYGLYHVDRENDLKRTLKKGALYYQSIVKDSKIY